MIPAIIKIGKVTAAIIVAATLSISLPNGVQKETAIQHNVMPETISFLNSRVHCLLMFERNFQLSYFIFEYCVFAAEMIYGGFKFFVLLPQGDYFIVC